MRRLRLGQFAQVIIVGTIRSTLIFVLATVIEALAQSSSLEQAVRFAQEQRYAEARRVLEGSVEPEGITQRIAFHRLKAAIASGLGETAAAANEMRSALALAPGDAGLQTATAAAELQAGLLDDAVAHAQGGAGTAVGQALLGDIQEKRGQYLEAVKAYQAAVALAPDREQYRVALALELVQHHTFEPAIAVLEQAAPRFPKSARLRVLLGVAQYAAGRYEDAEAALTDALDLAPELERVYGYLAQAALEAPSPPLERALKAICTREPVVCSALQSRSAREKGDAGLQALAVAALKRAPKNSAIARCELGKVYQAAAQWTEARVEFEACVQLDPSPQNHYRLGLVYNRLDLVELAQKQMELRKTAEERKAGDTARRQNAVQAFQYLIK
ncbi:MAG: Tetratricopeptide 2 repeat protein [Candidatus Solibacter sp.]|nr:Tetratricopeptide 2 repeat protein [Candidatus Solibacter sp.]